jgi:hypothetical protein
VIALLRRLQRHDELHMLPFPMTRRDVCGLMGCLFHGIFVPYWWHLLAGGRRQPARFAAYHCRGKAAQSLLGEAADKLGSWVAQVTTECRTRLCWSTGILVAGECSPARYKIISDLLLRPNVGLLTVQSSLLTSCPVT